MTNKFHQSELFPLFGWTLTSSSSLKIRPQEIQGTNTLNKGKANEQRKLMGRQHQ